VTPPQIQKGKAPKIQVIYPTSSYAAPEQEWKDDPSQPLPTEDEAKQIAELYFTLSALHKKWDPKALPFERYPNILIQLAATMKDLVRDSPMPSMAGMYSKTPRKPS